MNTLDNYLFKYVVNRVGLYSFALAVGDERALKMSELNKNERIPKAIEYGFTDVDIPDLRPSLVKAMIEFDRLHLLEREMKSRKEECVAYMYDFGDILNDAIKTGNLRAVKLVLDDRIETDYLYEVDIEGLVKRRDMELLEYLLSRKILTESHIYNILNAAAESSNRDMIDWAFAHGETNTNNAVKCAYDGETIKYLYQIGDKKNIEDVLFRASRLDDISLAEFAIENGARNINVCLENYISVDMANFLIKNGATISDDIVVYHIIIYKFNPSLMEIFIENGAVDHDRYLSETLKDEDIVGLEYIEFFLNKGARIEDVDVLSFLSNDTNLSRTLFDLLIDRNIYSANDLLILAAQSESLYMKNDMEYLVERGADNLNYVLKYVEEYDLEY